MSVIQQMLLASGGNAFSVLASDSAVFSSPWQITIPAHAGQSGDVVLLAVEGTSNGSPVTDSTPAGYTQITTSSLFTTYGYRASLFYKVTSASSSGEVITTFSSGGGVSAFVVVLRRNSSAISAVTVNSLNQTAVSTNPTLQTITISTAASFPALGVCFMAQASSPGTRASSGRTRSRTEIIAFTETSQLFLWIDEFASANIDVDTGDAGDANLLQSLYLTFT